MAPIGALEIFPTTADGFDVTFSGPAPDRPLRILFAADVAPDPDSGAAGTEWQTIQALRALGHEVDEIWAGDMPRRFANGNLHYLLELPRAFRRAIRVRTQKRSFDVFHVNQGHCYLAAIDHVRRRVPGVFVCRSHGLDDHMAQVLKLWQRRLGVRTRRGAKRVAGALLDRLLHRHDRLAYEHAAGVIVSSSIDARFLTDVRRVPAERVACIAQAPAAPFVATSAPAMSAARLSRILHVGGFAYWKGVHAVARAANELFEQDSEVSLTWVCRESEHAEVIDLLTPQAQSRVRLVGWVAQPQLVDIFDEHGIFLAPSLFEGFGKVFLEAMARGLCVIGTPTGGMLDVIEDSSNGFLVDCDDAVAIVARVNLLRANPEKANTMSTAAALRAREFSWQRVAQQSVLFYRSLLSKVPLYQTG